MKDPQLPDPSTAQETRVDKERCEACGSVVLAYDGLGARCMTCGDRFIPRLTKAPADTGNRITSAAPTVTECGERHPTTNARCTLPVGHEMNHHGQGEHGIVTWPKAANSNEEIRTLAKDLDFAIDVTEPVGLRLDRFEALIAAYSLRLRIATVHETVESMRVGGWIEDDDASRLVATLPALSPAAGRVTDAGEQATHPAPESREQTSRSHSDAPGAPQEPETKV